VTTPHGAEGMGLLLSTTKGEGPFLMAPPPFMVAQDSQEFISHVITLYQDPVKWLKQRLNGFQHLEDCFSQKAMQTALDEIMSKIMEQ
jgi:hypothetical protein